MISLCPVYAPRSIHGKREDGEENMKTNSSHTVSFIAHEKVYNRIFYIYRRNDKWEISL